MMLSLFISVVVLTPCDSYKPPALATLGSSQDSWRAISLRAAYRRLFRTSVEATGRFSHSWLCGPGSFSVESLHFFQIQDAHESSRTEKTALLSSERPLKLPQVPHVVQTVAIVISLHVRQDTPPSARDLPSPVSVVEDGSNLS